MLAEVIVKALMMDSEAIRALMILDELGCFAHLKTAEDVPRCRIDVFQDDRPLSQIFDEMYARPKNYKRS